MSAVATITSYTEKGLTAVALLLSAVALGLWSYHLLGATTPETMAHALTWTFLALVAHGVTYIVGKLGGA